MSKEDKNVDDYVINKLNQGLITSDIYILVKYYFNYTASRKTFQNYIGTLRRRCKKRLIKPSDVQEEALIRARIANQKLQDKNRIANKFLRGQDRYINFTSELFHEILEKLDRFGKFTIEDVDQNLEIKGKTAIIQLTDLHLGEEVTLDDTLGSNEYSVDICSKRLWKLARKIIDFLGDSVSDVVVALTGDLLNSDRRLDEMLTNASNRSETLIKAIQILSGFLVDLAKKYKITVISVFGNESRLDEDMPYRNPTHNFDFLIHKFLSMYLSNCKDRIKFMNVDRNYEKLYNVGGMNILFLHGYKYNSSMMYKIVAKYNSIGKMIDHIIIGHIHSIDIEDKQSRSGSVIGSNYYSTFKLHLLSRASQNLYIIGKEGTSIKPSICSIAIDLQNVDGCKSYKFDKDVCKIN